MKLSPIIEAEELIKIYNSPEVLIFDVSNGKDAKSNYEKEHIQGAFFIDLNTQLANIKEDVSQGGRHPLPSIENFSNTLTDLGITKKSHIIIYDDKNSSNAAARFWWMLQAIGHEKVQVLNGGLSQAKKHNILLGSGIETPNTSNEVYPIDKWNLPMVSIEEVENASHNKTKTIIDVRDKDRYNGITEPIDLIAGHIPNAINIPFTENLDSEGKFLPAIELNNKYQSILEVTNSENIIVHCGSGVTACHTLLALAYANMDIPNLYVGSWSEWSRNNKPMITKE